MHRIYPSGKKKMSSGTFNKCFLLTPTHGWLPQFEVISHLTPDFNDQGNFMFCFFCGCLCCDVLLYKLVEV